MGLGGTVASGLSSWKEFEERPGRKELEKMNDAFASVVLDGEGSHGMGLRLPLGIISTHQPDDPRVQAEIPRPLLSLSPSSKS